MCARLLPGIPPAFLENFLGAWPVCGDGAEEVSEEASEAGAVPPPVEAAAVPRPTLHGAERCEEVLAVAPE